MLIRWERLSGSCGGAGATGAGVVTSTAATSSTVGGASAGGAVAQPASTASGKRNSFRERLITKPDAQYVDLRRPQSTAQNVELTEVAGRAYAHTVIGFVIDCHALYL
jgi:hypothetical protein